VRDEQRSESVVANRLALGDSRRARDALQASRAPSRELGARCPEGFALVRLGSAADEEGDTAAAIADSLLDLGDLRLRTGDVDGARAALEEAATLEP